MFLTPQLPSRASSGVFAHELRSPDIVLPDYQGKGLFNLAVSLARCCQAEVPANYADLRLNGGQSASVAWQNAKTIVFFLIDGLGDAFLSANRDIAPTLWADRVGTITSVFPSTTATAITTLMTAQPAAVHGILGWYVREAVSGEIVAPLPMRRRRDGLIEDDAAVVSRLLHVPAMLGRARRRACLVTLPELAAGAYSKHHTAGAPLFSYRELEGLPASVAAAASSSDEAKFIYAYTPLLDGTAHAFGIGSPQSKEVLARIEQCYCEIRRQVPDALIVTSADHGFIDSPEERCVDLMGHPQIYDMLAYPLTGERRVAYCSVKPQFMASFGERVQSELGHALFAIRASEAIAAGLFGPLLPTLDAVIPVGDWLLFARDDWTFFDTVPGEDKHALLGIHGGLSALEMYVPLMVRPASG